MFLEFKRVSSALDSPQKFPLQKNGCVSAPAILFSSHWTPRMLQNPPSKCHLPSTHLQPSLNNSTHMVGDQQHGPHPSAILISVPYWFLCQTRSFQGWRNQSPGDSHHSESGKADPYHLDTNQQAFLIQPPPDPNKGPPGKDYMGKIKWKMLLTWVKLKTAHKHMESVREFLH